MVRWCEGGVTQGLLPMTMSEEGKPCGDNGSLV
jgi:hypothetical protein